MPEIYGFGRKGPLLESDREKRREFLTASDLPALTELARAALALADPHL